MCNNLFASAPASLMAEGKLPRGNAINRLCESLANPPDRRAFLENEDAYCLRFGLDKSQRRAVKDRNFLALIDAGGHVLYLDNLASLSGVDTFTAIRKRTGLPASAIMSKLLQAE